MTRGQFEMWSSIPSYNDEKLIQFDLLLFYLQNVLKSTNVFRNLVVFWALL